MNGLKVLCHSVIIIASINLYLTSRQATLFDIILSKLMMLLTTLTGHNSSEKKGRTVLLALLKKGAHLIISSQNP